MPMLDRAVKSRESAYGDAVNWKTTRIQNDLKSNMKFNKIDTKTLVGCFVAYDVAEF